MSGIEWIGLASVVGNLFLGLWGMFKKKKLAAVSDGLLVVEAAIEENKDVIGKLPHGKAVTEAITEYGVVVREAVNVARDIAHEIAGERYVARIIKRERAKHAAREAKREK